MNLNNEAKILHGTYVYHHNNKKLSYIKTYRNGVKVGLEEVYCEDGVPIYKVRNNHRGNNEGIMLDNMFNYYDKLTKRLII